LVKSKINHKSRSAHKRQDNFIKNVLLNRFGFKPEPEIIAYDGTVDLKTKPHRALTSRVANMLGGGYKAPDTPGKLKKRRASISNFLNLPIIRSFLNKPSHV
jgi:hypothetical protein